MGKIDDSSLLTLFVLSHTAPKVAVSRATYLTSQRSNAAKCSCILYHNCGQRKLKESGDLDSDPEASCTCQTWVAVPVRYNKASPQS